MDKNLEAAVAEHQQNKECARALKKLIDENFDGYRLDSDKVLSTAMNVFEEKRVELALASSIEQLSYDGRISTQNKNWAHGVMVAQDERNRDIRIDGHPGLLDTLAGDFRKLQKSLAERAQQQNEAENKEPVITVSGQSGTNNSFDVTSVGFDTEKQYAVAEFNQALKKANEKWQENWDGLSYPSNIIVVTVENLHNEPCTYRVNLTDADYNSIQDIVNLSPMPIYANIPTEKAIEILNKVEANVAREQGINTAENKVEHIPQQRDISHNTSNAALPAKRGESRGKIMEQNAMTTKFEMSSLSKLEGNGAKAIGTLVVNGEFAVHGVKVMEGSKGLFVSLPSEKRGGDWEEIVFPVTKEARAALNSAVLDAYEKLEASPDKTLKNEIATPSEPVSKIYAEMHKVESEKTQTKAAGQITIDKCFVITGVKVNEGTNTEGQTKTFVAMPGKLNETNGYDDIAHPITADIHAKVDKAVIASANAIGRYEYKGVKYAELGENPAHSKPMHPKYADKLMAQLDKAGITYQARCAETVVISVKAADKQAFEAMNKDLTAKLNGKDKPQQKQSTGTKNKNR